MKYYAVKNGIKPGIYETWAECEANVKGFSGAIFKSFPTKEAAIQFIDGDVIANQETVSSIVSPTSIVNEFGVTNPIAFVDGSFSDEKGAYAYGVVIIEDPTATEVSEIHLSGKDNDECWLESRNVAGEVLASIVAIQYALREGFDKLTIFHDYNGISNWANGSWKATKRVSKDYQEMVEQARNAGLFLDFQKVKGHSNNYYNDMVDTLAKTELGIPLDKKEMVNKIHPIDFTFEEFSR